MAALEKGRTGSQRVHCVTVVAAEADDLPICWICLDGPTIDKPLMHPCRCPSYCHARCIARWQLQSAGTRRERFCDFCSSELPEWKSVLTPSQATSAAPAVMNVNFDNKTYSFHVAPGADGYRQFTEAIRRAFHLPDDSELNITFTCDEPSTAGSLLTLSGPGAYDAAVHCASVSAARRSISSPDSSSPSGPATPAAAGRPQQQEREQQPEQAAADAEAPGAEEGPEPQEPPGTPRLADPQRLQQQQQHHHQLLHLAHLPPRPSTAGSSASSSSAGSALRQGGPVEHLLQESPAHQQQQQPAMSGAGASSHGSRSRSRSRGELGSFVRSLSHHSRSSSGSSLAAADAPAAAAAAGCLPIGGAAAGSNLVADADRAAAPSSSGSSSGGGGGALSRASSLGGASAGGSMSRRGSGLGRKLRDALADLLK